MQGRTTRLAAIDIGTNTVRMLAADLSRGALRPVARMRRITGMGKELRATGMIGDVEFGESVDALREIRGLLDSLGVVHYRACGTAALREAGNRVAFIEAARAAGVDVEVISASEEAKRTWQGIRAALRGGGDAVVMDIGGGSTEFIAGEGGNRSVSLPIGVVVALDALPLSDPPEEWQIWNARHYFGERIRAGTSSFGRRKYARLVGTAGTFTTLAALDMKMKAYRPERIEGYAMPLSGVRRWEARLARLSERDRLRLPGMEKGRERYIVFGACQAVAAMERFGADELVVSDSGILEGILLGLIREKGGKG